MTTPQPAALQPADVSDAEILRAVLAAGGAQYGEEDRYIDIEVGELYDAVRAILALRTAQQATPNIPNDGPSTYEQRFAAAVALICGVVPPADLISDWINKVERHDDLQQWVGDYALGWVQNIAVLDAAHQMADQPTEGGKHEHTQQATPEPYIDSTPHLSVGDSRFEGWFSDYDPKGKGTKQQMRDAYAAGMGDPLVTAATPEPVGEPIYQHQLADGSWIDQTKQSYDYNVKHGYSALLRVLYTHPAPAPQQVPMTDEQIEAMTASIFGAGTLDVEEIHAVREVVRTVEAHHGITAQAKGGE